MPYIVSEIAQAKKLTTYTIKNPYDGTLVGKVVTRNGRNGKIKNWSFTHMTGASISSRTNARQIHGMRECVIEYERTRYPLKPEAHLNIWGEDKVPVDTIPDIPAQESAPTQESDWA